MKQRDFKIRTTYFHIFALRAKKFVGLGSIELAKKTSMCAIFNGSFRYNLYMSEIEMGGLHSLTITKGFQDCWEGGLRIFGWGEWLKLSPNGLILLLKNCKNMQGV